MSDLDRLEDETSTEPVATTQSEPKTDTNTAGAPAASADSAEAPAGPKKKRRRGSRGGRNRKKKPAGANASTNAKATAADEDDEDELLETDDGERGLTDEVVAEQAREDAGMPTARPRIGDSRPAPTTHRACSAVLQRRIHIRPR